VRAIVYTWSSCGFCRRAKELLEREGVAYREVVLDERKDELRRLQAAFGRRTVPLILLDGEMLGGLEELEALSRAGKLAAPDDTDG
jgi:glutaredoxin 3